MAGLAKKKDHVPILGNTNRLQNCKEQLSRKGGKS